MEKVIGIGELTISNDRTDKIKTYALASCVAIAAYSRKKKTGGMIHVVLPAPIQGTVNNQPGYYATTGIPLLINKLCHELGCLKGELEVYIYGGADSARENDFFHIGKKNIKAVLDTLSGMNLKICRSDVGGVNSRTVEISMETGEVKVQYQPIRI